MKITGSQIRADDGGWSNTSRRKRFRSLFVAAAVCGRAFSWRRTIAYCTWGQHSSSLVLNKGMELQHALPHLAGDYFLGMLTGSLRAQNWQVRCVAIDGHTRDIAQRIYAKLNLILTVDLISLPMRPWKNTPRIITKNQITFLKDFLEIPPMCTLNIQNTV